MVVGCGRSISVVLRRCATPVGRRPGAISKLGYKGSAVCQTPKVSSDVGRAVKWNQAKAIVGLDAHLCRDETCAQDYTNYKKGIVMRHRQRYSYS